MRRFESSTLAALLVVLAASSTANAAGPTVEQYSDSASFVDSEFCEFPLLVDWQFQARAHIWTDSSGEPTRYVQHGVFSETVRANGKVAYAYDRQKVVDAQAGQT